MKTVGERIRQAREYRRLSGEELASKVGYKTQSGISNLENRASGRGGYALPKIAEVLNFSLDWFLNGPDTDDMAEIPPYQTAKRATEVHEPFARYDSPRTRAHSIIDQLSEQGVLFALEMLEGLAARHPLNQTERAGVPVPAHYRNVA